MTTRPFEMDVVTDPEYSNGAYNRRQEARVEDSHRCAYEISESDEHGAVTICAGQLVTVNRSAHGILLIMGEAPRLDQRIEVHNAKLGWLRSMMVYHVRWTRPIQLKSGAGRVLVGCRSTAGLPSTASSNRSSRAPGSV